MACTRMRSSGAYPDHGHDTAETEEHPAAHGEVGDLVVGEGVVEKGQKSSPMAR